MAGRVRSEDVALVRERVRIDEVIGEVVTLRSAGSGSLKGLCPFHDERTPSFHVTPARGLYYCFGCGEGGDVVDFLTKHDQMTFTEAIEKLALRGGVTLRYEDGGRPERSGPHRLRLAAANRVAAAFFSAALGSAEAERGRAFLSERGFDAGSWEVFGVGYAPRTWDSLLNHLRSAGFSDAESLAAGLVSQGQRGTYDRFRGRLVWPIRDPSGDVLGFGARRLFDDDEGPKYLNTPETALYRKSHVLYGIDLARRDIARRRQVVIVEGYTDVMAAHVAGVTTVVATCGTAFGADHAALLRRYLADDDTFGGEVIFTFDGDPAGQKAALRAFEGDQRFVAQTFIAVSPAGMDPCELRQARGDAAVRELVAGRTPLFAFAIRSAIAGFDLTTAEGRVGALRAAAPLVSRIRDTALRPEYARLVSGWIGMPEAEVRAAVVSAGKRGPSDRAGAQGSVPRGRTRPDSRSGGHEPALRGSGSATSDNAEYGASSGGGGQGAAHAGPPEGQSAGAAPRVARPNPNDARLTVEREALKCVLQVPDVVAQWYSSVGPSCFRHPWYGEIHGVVAAIGGPEGKPSGPMWVNAVLAGCADDTVRDLVRELAVEPLRTSDDQGGRYAVSIVARLLHDEAGRRLVEIKREVGQLDPITDAALVTDLFADLMSLESYRRELAGHARGDAT